jgi:hypothetical protein
MKINGCEDCFPGHSLACVGDPYRDPDSKRIRVFRGKLPAATRASSLSNPWGIFYIGECIHRIIYIYIYIYIWVSTPRLNLKGYIIYIYLHLYIQYEWKLKMLNMLILFWFGVTWTQTVHLFKKKVTSPPR